MTSVVMPRVIFLLIFLVVSIGFTVGSAILQVYLSKRESKWPGLALPIATFFLSVMVVLGIGMYGGAAMALVFLFLLMNIPTVILLVIYIVCRGKRQKLEQINLSKMSVQDLG